MKTLKTIGLAAIAFGALALFTISSNAQERQRSVTLTNTAFGTSYYLQGGTNVVNDHGQVIYQGGTNNQTGNMMAGMTVSNNYQGNTGVPFRVAEMQNANVLWLLAVHSFTNATYPVASVASNSVYYLDLSPVSDASFWVSNAMSATVTQSSVNTNQSATLFQYQNGTNCFTGYYWARWSAFNSSATNPIVTDRNQINQFR